MNLKKLYAVVFVVVLLPATLTVRASSITKADNNVTLDLGGSWTGGTAPGTNDVAVWDSTVTAAGNCTNSLAASTNWGGVQILNPAAPVEMDGNSTLFLGGSGIDLSGASQNLSLVLPVQTFADQNWTIASGHTLTFGGSGIIATNNTVTVSGNVTCTNGFSIGGGGTLVVSSGDFLLSTNSLSPANFGVGSDGSGAAVVQNGGNVTFSRQGATSGNPQPSLNVGTSNGGGTNYYYLNGGTLTDGTLVTNTVFVGLGNGTGAYGILNLNGGTATFYGLRLGNVGGHGIINVTNGTLIVRPSEFSIGRGSTGAAGSSDDGTINVYGGLISTPGTGVNLPHGNGPGVLNMYGGAFNIGSSLNVCQGSTGNGTLNLYGGVLTITNNLNLPSGGTGTGTVNLNGGILAVGSITRTGNGSACSVEFNGGTLKARSSTGNFIANTNLLTVHVDAGGAIIDTTNNNVTLQAVLQNGTGGGADGGLTKLGRGSLTLAATNSYTGSTIVGAGTLVLSTTNNNTLSGGLVVSNAAVLDTVLATTGSSLYSSSLTAGANPGDSVTAQFDLGASGNPGDPVIYATNLTVNGTVNVVINGSGFSVGTIPLIRYAGTVGGGGTFALQLLSGAAGYVTNNPITKTINVVVTGFPVMTWRAQVNSNWDLTTANWVDTNNSATVYVDGATVFFDDTTANASVYLTNAFNPAAMYLRNVNSNYVFSGAGSINGIGGLTKTGAGSVLMALTNNSYAGDTVISNGTFQLGVRNAIPSGTGRGNLTLEGKLDLAGFSQSVNGLNGSNGRIDNSGSAPAVLSVGNNSGVGVFAGQITNSGGSLALSLPGGSLMLLAANGYSGGTTNSGGILTLASPQSIGTGPLVLSGGTLNWIDALPHTLTNPMAIGGNVTLGASTNGPLTVASVVNFNGGARSLTCNSDVAFTNGIVNGSLSTKLGAGALLVMNTAADWHGNMQVSQGALVLDGATILADSANLRVQCTVAGGLSRLAVTNGGALLSTNGANNNLRVGASDTSGGSGCTNILDVSGTISAVPYPGGLGGMLYMGGSSSGNHDARDIVNLLPGGILQVRAVTNTATGVTATAFNFNGGTLMALTNDYAPFFDTGIIQVNVFDGGAVIDTAGFDNINFANDLNGAGAGGPGNTGIGSFTKNGAGQLIVSGKFGNATYGGATIVNAGTLDLSAMSVPYSTNFFVAAGATLNIGSLELTAGKSLGGGGTVLGSVTVDSGAFVAPGTATSAGALTFNNAPALNGTTILKLNKGGAPANDQIALSGGTLNYGGALVVTNVGFTPTSGDRFYLFSAPSGFSGAFSSVSLPPLPRGLGWTNDLANQGLIVVTGVPPVFPRPVFTSAGLAGNSLVFTGTNGLATNSFKLLATTNLALPLTNWTVINTYSFDAAGNFRFTNTLSSTNALQFYDVVY